MPDADRGRAIRNDRAPTRLPGWAAAAAAALYGREIARRNAAYDAGRGVERLPLPVISVGNLSAGGTGKTPMVRWVARVLAEEGVRPVIAMRGYKARPGAMSDEEREHRDALPGVPVVARPDRAVGVRALLESPDGAGLGCVVLDDGFQHRRLARDLDIVLIDASRPPDRDALLPRGYLREPIGSLSRAGAVVITHAELVEPADIDRVLGTIAGALPSGVPAAVAEHAWTGLRRVDGDEPGGRVLDEGAAWLHGRRVVAVCAIGQPAGFLAAVDRSGADRVATMVLADHDAFGVSTLGRLDGLVKTHQPDAVVMTAKDHAKLGGPGGWATVSACPVVVPALGVGWRSGESAVRGAVIAAAGGRRTAE